VLASSLGHYDLNEAFAPDESVDPPTFLRFMKDHSRSWPDPYLFEEQQTLHMEYLDWLVENVSSRLIVDVKYTALNMGLPYGFTPADPSRLLHAFDSRGAVIVHLVRENSLDVAVSCLLAKETSIYHWPEDEPMPVGLERQVMLDPAAVLDVIDEHQVLVQLTRYALRRVSNVAELSYDAVTKSPPDMSAVAPLLQARFGYKRYGWEQGTYVKLAGNWRDRVSNHAEIAAALRGTRHERFLG
jgi:hypothetical protein